MRRVENLLWIVGLLLAGLFFAAQAWGDYASKRDMAGVSEARAKVALEAGGQAGSDLPPRGSRPSQDAPSMLRASVAGDADAAIAVLRIPSVELQVPVSMGTSERVLIRGAGLIEGSPEPGTGGNVGIAAHRDSHFRALKDVAIGDLVEIETVRGSHSYRITELSVVEPDAVHVLADIGSPVLTLVTCYPFYFVGHAPQRFIVRAVAAEVPTQDPQENHHETIQ